MVSYQTFLFADSGKDEFVAALRAGVDQYARKQGRLVSVMADNRRVRLQFEPEIYAFYMGLCDDDQMEFFNDYFGLLEIISAIPGTIIFDYVNRRFFRAP